ncbi:MAG: hypothetical protein M1821_008912 [Bathelium mastoideum]|nr:MAG: hypothetical protein M1821_008912 [Bathelium mastoideum]
MERTVNVPDELSRPNTLEWPEFTENSHIDWIYGESPRTDPEEYLVSLTDAPALVPQEINEELDVQLCGSEAENCDNLLTFNNDSIVRDTINYSVPLQAEDYMPAKHSDLFQSSPYPNSCRSSNAPTVSTTNSLSPAGSVGECSPKNKNFQKNKRHRHPPHVKKLLEDAYKENPRPSREKCDELAQNQDLTELKVYNFFKNKRQQQRSQDEKDQLGRDLGLFSSEVNRRYKNPQLRMEMRHRSKTERARNMALSTEAQTFGLGLPVSSCADSRTGVPDMKSAVCDQEMDISWDEASAYSNAHIGTLISTEASRLGVRGCQSHLHNGCEIFHAHKPQRVSQWRSNSPTDAKMPYWPLHVIHKHRNLPTELTKNVSSPFGSRDTAPKGGIAKFSNRPTYTNRSLLG